MKYIFVTLLLVLTSVAAMAQVNIERQIAKIEKSSSTQYVAYSEERDPNSHKILRSSKVLVINSHQAQALKEAIHRDREKSVAFEMNSGCYNIVFNNDDYQHCYTLYQQRDGTWLLTVVMTVKRKSKRTQRRASSYTFNNASLLDGAGFQASMDDLDLKLNEAMKDLDQQLENALKDLDRQLEDSLKDIDVKLMSAEVQ